MKKLFALVLALVFALSFAVPALAFTEVTYADDDNPVTLNIKLIDVGDGIVNVNFTAPPSNRGYVKNEVVCAIVSMYVPKGAEIKYDELVFYGENVTLWQDENFYGDQGELGVLNHISKNVADVVKDIFTAIGDPTFDGPFMYAANMSIDNEITLLWGFLDFFEAAAEDKAQTYHFAIFGKVTGDDAWMKAKLVGEKALENAWVAYALENAQDSIGDTDFDGYLLYDDVAIEFPPDNSLIGFQTITVKDDYEVGYYNPKKDVGGWPIDIGSKTLFDDGISDGTYGNPKLAADDLSVDPDSVLTLDAFDNLNLGADDIVYVALFDAPAVFGQPAGTQVAFIIVTDKKYNCTAMYVWTDAIYQIKVVGSKYTNAQFISPWGVYVQFEDVSTSSPQTVIADAGMASLMARDIVEEVIWDVFGLNLNKKGQMKPEFWASDDVLEAEVQVSPWYNEVTVPAEIELEAPKTGDVVSALGFVLIAIAGLAFVAVRKVRA